VYTETEAITLWNTRPAEQAIRSEYEGEPVAWMYERPNTAYPVLPNLVEVERFRSAEEYAGWTETPLYTRPSSEQAIRADERGKALDEAAALALKLTAPGPCENVGAMDWETGVRECLLGDDRCQCLTETVKGEEISTAILALKSKGQGDAE
jgi:hypothetical protein